MLKTLAYIVLAWVALAAVGGVAHAARVVQLEPYYGATWYVLDIYLTNDNPGAIYNSAYLDAALFGGLAEQLYALPVNTHTFGSPQEMMGQWHLNVRSQPTGSVYNGWQAAIEKTPGSQNIGAVTLTNNGGWPGFDYDLWTAAAGQNTMALTLRIPLSQLEVDGVGGYDPNRDAKIVLTDTTLQQAFVADAGDGLNYWSAPAALYGVLWPGADCAAANVSGSGTVGLGDLAQVAEMWLMQGLFLKEDINKDGIVDLHDFLHIARWWERTCE